jgi:uncharacterized membrane protein
MTGESENLKQPLNVERAAPTLATPAKPNSQRWVTIAAILGLIILGTCNTLILKFQDVKGFRHPAFQGVLVLMGQFLNYFTFWIPIMSIRGRSTHFRGMKELSDVQGKSVFFPPWWMALSAFFDVLSTICINTALFLLEPSICQMLRGAIIIACCFMSRIFLKTQIHRHHALGLVFATVGFVLGKKIFLKYL